MTEREEEQDDAISQIDGSSLFSDGDSDIVDSPADGYFMQRSHPQQFFTTADAVSSTKEQEARQAVPQTYHESLPVPSSSQHRIWADEQAPLLDAGPAPPDYYAATADRRREGGNLSFAHMNRYGVPSYGSIQHEEEEFRPPRETPQILLQAGLFSSERAPQSMSNHVGDQEQQSLSTKPHRRRIIRRLIKHKWLLRCVNLIVFCLLVTGAILACLWRFRHHNSVKVPKYPATPITPSPAPSPTRPLYPGIPSSIIPTPPAEAGCSFSDRSDVWTYDFHDIKDFSFSEHFETRVTGVSVAGETWIRRGNAHQGPDVVVSVSFITSSGIHLEKPTPDITADSMRIGMPFITFLQKGLTRTCLSAFIMIEIKPGVTIRNWEMTTWATHMNSRSEDLFNTTLAAERQPIYINGTSKFTAMTGGTIDLSYWSSRETIIQTRSGTVHGWFALRDLLKITTSSGAVIVALMAFDEDPERPLPGTFNVTTSSGLVKADFDPSYLKVRDYNTFIRTSSGSISGSYIHGSVSSFESHSGSIVAEILPVIQNNSTRSKLYTKNNSGQTSVIVETPYGSENLTNMHSIHDSSHGSGSQFLRYPDSWAGTLEGRSTSGSLTVRGNGVHVDYYSDLGWLGGRTISGRKGDGNSLIEFKTTSGSADLGIGSHLRPDD